MKEWVRGFGSISTAGNPLTPTLSPSGERERTEFAARLGDWDAQIALLDGGRPEHDRLAALKLEDRRLQRVDLP